MLSLDRALAILGLLTTVGLWLMRAPKQVEADDAELAVVHARTLARIVVEEEGLIRRQLLGNDVQPINLRFLLQRPPSRGATALLAGQAHAGEEATLPDITAYYRATTPSRLVITGAAGSGKTTLSLELLLALIAGRGENDPVPVRIPLIEWNTSVPLRSMLIHRLIDAYKWPAASAANLVEHGMVLPVLDGLDEMDATRPDGTPGPAALQMRAALEQLNSFQDRDGLRLLPLILTCRTAHYDALRHTDTLIDAARISLAPVDAPTAAAYLGACARDPRRWEPVLHHLRTQPSSHCARLLSTPWRLCLAATVYHRSGDPAELLTYTSASGLDEFLLSRYIPASAQSAGSHGYPPEQIHRWLHHLAMHVARNYGTQTSRDHLVLHLLRPPGPRVLFRAVDAILSLLPFTLLFGAARAAGAPSSTTGFVIGAAIISVMAAVIGQPSTPARIDLGLLATRGRRQLVPFILVILIGGPFLAALGGGTGHSAKHLGLALGYVCALAYALTFTLTVTLTVDTPRAVRSRAVIHDDAVLGITAAVGLGTMMGVGVAGTDGILSGIVYFLATALGAGLLRGSTARRYTVFLLCSSRWLPFRLGRFLDWACTAGLMRHSGPAYQFRHNELQTWITAHPEPAT
ncbi:NACHT domain-containing protein [Streptomyces griseorubiginosus]|uniref:NACHT domain-containing protein n=1 Tax=Streptomyces griseorubiginosus TaxID=67304 RepID=UPI0033193F47